MWRLRQRASSKKASEPARTYIDYVPEFCGFDDPTLIRVAPKRDERVDCVCIVVLVFLLNLLTQDQLHEL
eukprot:8227037-Pyramimonas_sp.AAC.1